VGHAPFRARAGLTLAIWRNDRPDELGPMQLGGFEPHISAAALGGEVRIHPVKLDARHLGKEER
jgi:hypothetical protein